MTHPNLFEAMGLDSVRLPALIEATEARDQALAQVESNANDTWKDAALEAVRILAAWKSEFIVDEVWPLIHGVETHDNRAMGAVMIKAKKEGWIHPTNEFRPSPVAAHHANPRRVWKSLIFARGVA